MKRTSKPEFEYMLDDMERDLVDRTAARDKALTELGEAVFIWLVTFALAGAAFVVVKAIWGGM